MVSRSNARTSQMFENESYYLDYSAKYPTKSSDTFLVVILVTHEFGFRLIIFLEEVRLEEIFSFPCQPKHI